MKWLWVVLALGACRKPCEQRTECECYAARETCQLQTEPCWCPSVCNPSIACVCGGGKFLRCQEK